MHIHNENTDIETLYSTFFLPTATQTHVATSPPQMTPMFVVTATSDPSNCQRISPWEPNWPHMRDSETSAQRNSSSNGPAKAHPMQNISIPTLNITGLPRMFTNNQSAATIHSLLASSSTDLDPSPETFCRLWVLLSLSVHCHRNPLIPMMGSIQPTTTSTK